MEFYNSQVLLKGCEEKGYVIISTAKASLLTSDHCPVWREQTLRSKSTIVGSVDSVQVQCMRTQCKCMCTLLGEQTISSKSTIVCASCSTTRPSTRRLLLTTQRQRPVTVQRRSHVTTTSQ